MTTSRPTAPEPARAPRVEPRDEPPVLLPRQRSPLSARRCTCMWSDVEERVVPDPFCPSAVRHVDDARLQGPSAADRT